MSGSLRNLALASLSAALTSLTALPAIAGDDYRGGYDGSYGRGYDERDDRRDWYDRRDDRGNWDSYHDRRYRGFVVCDPDGDRCYRSRHPYWSYREYYRRHGYRWLDD